MSAGSRVGRGGGVYRVRVGHDASKCRSVCGSGAMCLSVGPSTADPIDCCVSQAAGHSLGVNLICRDGFIPHTSDVPCAARKSLPSQSYDHSATLYTCCANSTAGAEQCEYRAEGEDTLFWMVRWGLWHLVIVCVVETKLRVLPRKLAWLPILWGGSMMIVLYSGSFRLWGWSAAYGGGQLVHVLTAFFVFFFSWWEAVSGCYATFAHTIFWAVLSFGLAALLSEFVVHAHETFDSHEQLICRVAGDGLVPKQHLALLLLFLDNI